MSDEFNVVKTSIIIDRPINQIAHKDLGRLVVTMVSAAKRKAKEVGAEIEPKYRLDLYAEIVKEAS